LKIQHREPSRPIIFIAAVLIAGCSSNPTPPKGSVGQPPPEAGIAAPKPSSIQFATPGESSAMPSLAVAGRRVALVWTGAKNAVMNVYLAVSEDGGATFPVHTRVNDLDGDVAANVEQPPRVAVSAGDIAVVWPSKRTGSAAIRMARSKDGGRTFSHAITLHDATLKGARGWQSLTVGPDGLLRAMWLDGRNAQHMPAMDHSSMQHTGSPRQDVYAAVIDASDHVSETQVAANVCFCCKTAIVAAGDHRVFAVWRNIFPGSIRDIAMAVSADGGRSFAPLSRVSADEWQIAGCPEDGPAIAVDSGETVHIVWPTVVTKGGTQKVVFYSSTKDGRAFTPRVRLSGSGQDEAAHPQIAVGHSGSAGAVWDEPVGDMRLVVFRPIWPGGKLGVGRSLNSAISGSHPVIASVDDGFLIAWTSGEGASAAIALQHLRAEDPPGAPGSTKSFVFRGRVEEVDRNAKRLTVAGDDVPGWMSAMTMTYGVDDAGVIPALKPGDRITATVYDGDFEMLHGVTIVPGAAGNK